MTNVSSLGTLWARTHGRSTIRAESGPPARREPDDVVEGQLVSTGGRSSIPREQQTVDSWLRFGDGSGGVWQREISEASE